MIVCAADLSLHSKDLPLSSVLSKSHGGSGLKNPACQKCARDVVVFAKKSLARDKKLERTERLKMKYELATCKTQCLKRGGNSCLNSRAWNHVCCLTDGLTVRGSGGKQDNCMRTRFPT